MSLPRLSSPPCRSTTTVALFLLTASLTADTVAQVSYVEQPLLTPRRRAGLGYDPVRERVVLFGGTQSQGSITPSSLLSGTWEWDQNGWTRRQPATEPSISDSTRGFAYDPRSRRVVLFNHALISGNATQVWYWNGQDWRRDVASGTPSYRQHYAVAFDERRQRLVVWGGESVAGGMTSTWEFDGSAWTELVVAAPSGRNDAAMAWDGVRQRVVLFGGRTLGTSPSPLGDMFEWDGVAWQAITPANLPPARNQHSLTWDAARRRVVLFGGGTGLPGTLFDDTWEWDGTNWRQINTPARPPARAGHGAVYHAGRQRVMIACGEGSRELLSDAWEYDGSTWTLATPAPTPPARSDHAACFDTARSELVVFGGSGTQAQPLADTWVRGARGWEPRRPTSAPSARQDHAMVFDTVRNRAVLFGGRAGNVSFDDTWQWDGTNWSQMNPATRPSARHSHAMAFDVARGRVVLFGGAAATLLRDTWEWDGSSWTQVTTTTAPPAREGHAMLYDSRRNQVVVTAGRTSTTTYLSDTWRFDLTGWTLVATGGVTARADAGYDFDPIRGVVVVYGGMAGASLFVGTSFEWNGIAWVSMFALTPSPRAGTTLTWDPVRRHMVLFGGRTPSSPIPIPRADAFVLTERAAFTQIVQVGGCSGTGGPVAPLPYGRPALGNGAFALDMQPPFSTVPLPVYFFLSRTRGTGLIGGCQLAVAPDTLFHLAYGVQRGNHASLHLPVPLNLDLAGAEAYVQAMYIDATAQLGGLAFTMGTRLVLGD